MASWKNREPQERDHGWCPGNVLTLVCPKKSWTERENLRLASQMGLFSHTPSHPACMFLHLLLEGTLGHQSDRGLLQGDCAGRSKETA